MLLQLMTAAENWVW